MIKIEYNSTKEYTAGIYYGDSLINRFYLDADLGKPIYSYEEEGDETVDGEFKKTFAKIGKQYRITTYLMEYMIDAISAIQLHDVITVTNSSGREYQVTEFKMSEPEWDEGVGCLANVTITFGVFQDSLFSRC